MKKNELKPCKHCGDVTCNSCQEAKKWEVLMIYIAVIIGGFLLGMGIHALFF